MFTSLKKILVKSVRIVLGVSEWMQGGRLDCRECSQMEELRRYTSAGDSGRHPNPNCQEYAAGQQSLYIRQWRTPWRLRTM